MLENFRANVLKKRLSSCPARLERFLIRALKYDVAVNYMKCPDVPIAHALSRVSRQPAPSNRQLPEICVHSESPCISNKATCTTDP